MKKLEDFECEKVEINTIYGGNALKDFVTYGVLANGQIVEQGMDN